MLSLIQTLNDLISLKKRQRRFSYIKKVDAWSTVLFVDPFAIALTEATKRYFAGKIFPDHFTALSILFNFAGIALVCLEQSSWLSASLIFLSIVMDCTDGKVARALNVKTRHGALCDALADCLNHGIGFTAIAIFLYTKQSETIGALLVAVFAVYLTLAHINDVAVHLGLKQRNSNTQTQAHLAAKYGLLSHPFDIVDLAFLWCPVYFIFFPNEPLVFALPLSVFAALQILNSIKRRPTLQI